MRKSTPLYCLILLLFLSTGCNKTLQADTIKQPEVLKEYVKNDYAITASGDLHINYGDQTSTLEINALPDGQILQDEHQRLLILSDPTERYQHGILGDVIEASSVTLVQLADQPSVIRKFSVPAGWVIESILPLWSDWDGDGQREIVLTLSNKTSGSKLVLYDEGGNVLAESNPIGKGFRWRHAFAIDVFGENGEKLLVDVQTPHIGGIVGFYTWNKEEKMLKSEATLSGYSTHDIGSREMNMYALMKDDDREQILLVLPNQSKTEIVGLRLKTETLPETNTIKEEWRLALGGKLSGKLELIEENGVPMIRAIVDGGREVLLNIPK